MTVNRRTVSFFMTLLVAGFFATTPSQADAKLADCTIDEFHEFDCPFNNDAEDQGSNDDTSGDGIDANDGETRQGYPIHSRDDERDDSNDEPPRRR